MEIKKARINDWVNDIIKRKPDKGSSGRKEKHRSLERQQSVDRKESANYIRSRSLDSRVSSGRQRKQPGQGHGQPEGIYTSPRPMQPSYQGYGTNYSPLSPSNQCMNIITSPSRANQGQQLRPIMMGQAAQLMLDHDVTLIGSPMTSPGFNPSCMMSPASKLYNSPPQYPQPVQYQHGSQMAQCVIPGQSVQYNQLGGHYLSYGQPDAPGNYPNPGQPDIPGNYAIHVPGNSLGQTGIPGNYASHELGNPAGQEGNSQFVSSFKGAIAGLAQWLPGIQGAGIPNNPPAMDQMNLVYKQM